MELSLAVLADYANISREGKLNVMGIFDRIYSSTFPTRHPDMHVVVKFLAPPAERGTTKRIVYKLLNADGKVVLETGNQFAISAESKSLTVEFVDITRFVMTPFDAPGQYAFHILVNDETKGRIPFEVVELKQDASEVH